MSVPFYDIKAQYDDLAEPLSSTVQSVLSGGNYVLGSNNKDLEAKFAALHGTEFGIAVHSGTDALRIMMDAAGIVAGDEVITTAFTFVASVETIVQTGATPVFVDIDPNTFMITPQAIEAAITPRTKAILPVHLFGQLCDIVAIRDLAARHNLVVLEDAAQAVESTHNGVAAGGFGLAAGFSFYVTKNLGAAGDGGMILTNDAEYAERCRSIRVHGMGRERYYYDHLGYTGRLDEIQCAVLVVKMTMLADWTARRISNAKYYAEQLSEIEGLSLPIVSPGNNHTYHQFTVKSTRRDALQAHLNGQGIPAMIYYPVPIHHHAPYKRFAPQGELPETAKASAQVLSLPIQPHLTPKHLAAVVAAVKSFV